MRNLQGFGSGLPEYGLYCPNINPNDFLPPEGQCNNRTLRVSFFCGGPGGDIWQGSIDFIGGVQNCGAGGSQPDNIHTSGKCHAYPFIFEIFTKAQWPFGQPVLRQICNIYSEIYFDICNLQFIYRRDIDVIGQ